jgi:hypothetical protein
MAANLNREPDQTFKISFSLSEVTIVDRFVARGEELAQIHKELSHGRNRRTVVVHGLGGIGKTQLAAAYAKRHYTNYSAIFWLNVRDKTSLKQGYMRMAQRILREHPTVIDMKNAVKSGDLDEAVQAVKQWLDMPKNDRWLIIYDNYDSPRLERSRLEGISGEAGLGKAEARNKKEVSESYDIRPFLPDAYQGAVLITTRSSTVKIGHRIQLRKLKRPEDSLDILAYTSNRQGVYNGLYRRSW